MTGISEACNFFTALALITTTVVGVVTVSQHAECTITSNLSSYHSPIFKKILCWTRPLKMQQPFNLAYKSSFETHTVRAACRDESSLWYPHRWGRKAPRKQAALWIGRACVLRPPAPTNNIKIRNVNSSSEWTDQLLLWNSSVVLSSTEVHPGMMKVSDVITHHYRYNVVARYPHKMYALAFPGNEKYHTVSDVNNNPHQNGGWY